MTVRYLCAREARAAAPGRPHACMYVHDAGDGALVAALLARPAGGTSLRTTIRRRRAFGRARPHVALSRRTPRARATQARYPNRSTRRRTTRRT
ncbi:hypothetical protein BLAT2472_11389 [Burkholderia latens]